MMNSFMAAGDGRTMLHIDASWWRFQNKRSPRNRGTGWNGFLRLWRRLSVGALGSRFSCATQMYAHCKRLGKLYRMSKPKQHSRKENAKIGDLQIDKASALRLGLRAFDSLSISR